MKTKKIIIFLIILVIMLSIGLVFTTVKLINTAQLNTNTPSENNNKKDVVENPIEIPEPQDNLPIEDDNELSKEDDVKNNNVEEVVNTNDNIGKKDNAEKSIINAPENNPSEVKGIDDEKSPKDNNNKNNNEKNDKKNNDKNDKSILDNSMISKDRAIEIGLKKVGSGGTLEKISPKLNDNPPKYSMEILKNKHKYSIEIHARTGAILEHEKKKIKD